ncbi:MAG: glucuronate isomerase [Verrucomicrobia bacterium]|nr:glucuronate isomerase [Verrucomicrobiota bacterium]
MSSRFIHDDFILETQQAVRLYHEFAEGMPIVDYHCHLPPQEVAADTRWENLSQVWLSGDHYKWRTMRSNGVDERFCTGDASDREKFDKFAETMPYLLRNPMYHWSHLELARYFGIDDVVLSSATADDVWTRSQQRLQEPDMSARGLMKQSQVVLVCTTDDPTDSLEHHVAVAADASFSPQMLPTWRPDKVLAIDKGYLWNSWIEKLEEATDMAVDSVKALLSAIQKRHDFFASVGCRLSDYGVDTVYADPYTDAEIEAAFQTARGMERVSVEQVRKFRSAMLYECARMDAASDWTMQIHYGAQRNNNSRMGAQLGPDTGFDSIGDLPIAEALSRFLDRLDRDELLPRTILYTLNPRDNEVLGTMLGNFQDGRTPGKIQFGSGWWFNDQMDGMLRHMEALSQLGLLSRFVGMLTDSRSFLSYTRHEYFRRILCNLLGHDMSRGLIPDDFNLVGGMVKDICYNNASRYFGFKLDPVG